jgi:mannose-6-phosphate isomerase-like protein (cupin superfamily)
MMKHSFWRSAVLLFVLSAAALRAQAPKADSPGSAILIHDAQMQSKLKNMIAAKIQDDAIRVVKAGEGNLGVFLIHLNPSQPPQPPVQLMSHNDVAEVYYVLRGEGVLYHRGTIDKPTPRELATTGGPSLMGPGKDNSVENVGPGDVFIIPPNTPHQVNLGAKTEMVYLVVRVDPRQHLQVK